MARNRISLSAGLSDAGKTLTAVTPEPASPEPASPEPASPEPASPEPKTPKKRKAPEPKAPKSPEVETDSGGGVGGKPTRARRAAQDSRVSIGVYLTDSMYSEMKSAYLADWSNGGEADTFYRWVEQALDAHIRRGAAGRAQNGRLPTAGRAKTTTGATKAFKVDPSVLEQMRQAIVEDQAAGRWPSDSAWCVEAFTLAVEAARDANGGTLPTPPARLPNRLKRA